MRDGTGVTAVAMFSSFVPSRHRQCSLLLSGVRWRKSRRPQSGDFDRGPLQTQAEGAVLRRKGAAEAEWLLLLTGQPRLGSRLLWPQREEVAGPVRHVEDRLAGRDLPAHGDALDLVGRRLAQTQRRQVLLVDELHLDGIGRALGQVGRERDREVVERLTVEIALRRVAPGV